MKTHIKTLAILSALALATSVQAQVTETDGLGTSWLGTPTFMTATAATFTSSEGNFGSTGGSGGFGALGQTFVLSQSGTLQNIQLVLAGGVQTFYCEIYDLGAYPSSGYPANSATYTPASLTDLLGGGDGDVFTYNAHASGAQNVAELAFSGADANITLQAGELYAFQIDPAAAQAAYWVRDGVQVLNVQGYRMNQFSAGNMGAINGNDQRDFSLAVTVAAVPEPASMTLLGLSVLVGGILIRRRQKA